MNRLILLGRASGAVCGLALLSIAVTADARPVTYTGGRVLVAEAHPDSLAYSSHGDRGHRHERVQEELGVYEGHVGARLRREMASPRHWARPRQRLDPTT